MKLSWKAVLVMARSKTNWTLDVRYALSYVYNNAVRNAKSFTPFSCGEFRGIPHYFCLLIRQLSSSRFFSARALVSSEPYCICRIFFWRYPAQVVDRVIGCVSVPMRNLVFWRWWHTYKRYSYSPMNVHGPDYTAVIAHVNILVSVSKRPWFKHFACLFSAYAPSIRHFIVGEPNYVFPDLLAHGDIVVPYKSAVRNEVI